MIELLEVSCINGKRHSIDYDYRKSEFATIEEMDAYKRYLEKRLDKQLLFEYKDKRQKI